MKVNTEQLTTVLLALVIFAVVNKLFLERMLEKIPHLEEMLEE